MSDIMSRIVYEIEQYEHKHCKSPNTMKLGRLDYKELMHILFDILNNTKYDKNTTHIFGVEIVVVEEDRFLELSTKEL